MPNQHCQSTEGILFTNKTVYTMHSSSLWLIIIIKKTSRFGTIPLVFVLLQLAVTVHLTSLTPPACKMEYRNYHYWYHLCHHLIKANFMIKAKNWWFIWCRSRHINLHYDELLILNSKHKSYTQTLKNSATKSSQISTSMNLRTVLNFT